MTFEAYLKNKKINEVLFQKNDFELWNKLKEVFEQVHPESFTVQKKFLINDLRRKYRINEEEN